MSGAALVVGGGHNGLVAALRLAAAGRRVTVLERRRRPGGMAAAEEFHPGYRVPGLLHDTTGVRPAIARELALERHGLAWRPAPPVVAAAPGAEPRPVDDTAPGLSAWRDAAAALRPFLSRLQERPPPPLRPAGAGDLLRLGLDGLALRRLGRRRAAELLRVLPMPVADWLGESVADEELAGALALPALLGVFAGPRSPGTAGALLLAGPGDGREVAGGPAALVAALVAAAAAAGVELRCEAEVSEIEHDGERVGGVRLAGGERLAAGLVVAACDARSALLDLLPPGSLGLEDQRAVAAFRCRGTVAKLHLALSGAPRLPGAGGPVELARAGTLDELERSFDAAKYGRLPESPGLELRLPSLADPELAPPGHHVASVLVAGVPPRPRPEGWTPALREQLEKTVVGRLEALAPGIGAQMVATELLTPAEIEERYAAAGGHPYHGEMALDQLLSLRPAPGAGHYRTPVAGLYLAGSGSHPGGGVSGLPGWLGAGAALEDQSGR